MERITIADACTLHARIGWQGLTKAEYLDEGDYYLITGVDFNEGLIDFENCHFVSEDRYIQDEHIQVAVNDVLVTKDGTIGKVAIVDKLDKPATLNSGVFVVRPRNLDELLPEFLVVALRSGHFTRFIEQIKVGCTIAHLNQEKFLKYDIPRVSVEEQRYIVETLSKAEQAIKHRKQEIQLLDNLIKARFVELFGDPTKYEVEPLNDNVEEMFIGPFGSALKNEYFVDEDMSYCMVYEQKHAIQKTMDLPTRYVDESKYNELKRFTVLGGDIIVSCRGTIGEIYSIPENAPMGIMHPSIMKIRLKKNKYCNLFFVMMLEQYMQDSMSKAKGSGVKMAVTATELGKEMFVVPNIEEQKAFEEFVKQIDKSKVAVQKALDETQLLFDSLMQQYFG